MSDAPPDYHEETPEEHEEGCRIFEELLPAGFTAIRLRPLPGARLFWNGEERGRAEVFVGRAGEPATTKITLGPRRQ